MTPGKHECKGLVCGRARLVGLEALARSEHGVKGTQPRDSGAVWQASARGPKSAIATRLSHAQNAYSKIIGGEGTGGWRLRLGSPKGSPSGRSDGGHAVFNRAKGSREESRPAGPRGPQETACQRDPSSGVVPPAHAQLCKLSPGGVGWSPTRGTLEERADAVFVDGE